MNTPHDPEVDDPTMLDAARYVDGQLSPAERAAFAMRLSREPALATAVRLTQSLRAPFAAVRDAESSQLSPGFAARVLHAARRLPTPAERGVAAPGQLLDDSLADTTALPLARRMLVAAAFIFGLGLLTFGGLLRRGDSSRLEAAPVLLKKLDDLDAKIRAGLRSPDAGSVRPR